MTYIWLELQYFALNMAADSCILITTEAIKKCRKLNNLHICKGTETLRTIDGNTACVVQLEAGTPSMDMATCKIKVIKIRNLFWSRIAALNTLMYSTNSKEKLFITCK